MTAQIIELSKSKLNRCHDCGRRIIDRTIRIFCDSCIEMHDQACR